MLNYMRRHAQGTTIKILFWIIIAVFILWGVGSFTGSDDLYAAAVNGESISPTEVRRTARQLEQLYRQLYGEKLTPELIKALDFNNRALDQIINGTLLKQEARRLGFSVTDEEVRSAIQGIQGLNVDGRFQREVYFRYLRAQGVTAAEFEAQEKDRLLGLKVQELVNTSIRSDETGARELFGFQNEKANLKFVRVKGSDLVKEITPSEAELAKYYEEHREAFREPERVGIDFVSYEAKDFAKGVQLSDAEVEQEYNTYKTERYSEPEEVHARHVLLAVAPGADDKQRDAARERATAVLERLKKGEDFAAVAKEVSEDTANKNQGGDLGFIGRGRTEEAFENAAFGLQPGELSAVVETRFGFHIIKVDDRKAAREKPFAEVRDEIARSLSADRAHAAARDAAFVDAEKASGGAPLAELAKARGLTVENPPPFAEHEEIRGLGFQQELSRVAFATPPGQAGSVTQVGEELILFRVREKLQTRVPDLGEIRDKVETAVRNEQSTVKARERAEAIRKQLGDKKTLEDVAAAEKLTVEETGPFTRSGDYVPRIGSAPELKKQVFTLGAARPMAPEVTVVSGDAYVVVLKERMPADMAEFEKKKQELVKRHLDEQRQAAMTALLDQLKRRAKIQINPAALASI
ncbi:MAG: SurA N-terminal domain-containing protein [Candidatus Binatia bacterium]